jgi:hypothetical protein
LIGPSASPADDADPEGEATAVAGSAAGVGLELGDHMQDGPPVRVAPDDARFAGRARSGNLLDAQRAPVRLERLEDLKGHEREGTAANLGGGRAV